VDAWRLNDQGYDKLFFIDQDGSDIEVTVHYLEQGGYRLQLPGGEVIADGEIDEGDTLRAHLDGLKVSAAVVRDSDTLTILIRGEACRIEFVDRMALVDVDLEEGSKVTAPLPGKIVQVMVKPGSGVKKGDPLLILEAMKMEHAITASRDAVIADIPFAIGEQVTEGTELVLFEPERD
jgi:3-methylcrotonyl-CoA carboxylase alpha subunit